MTQITAPTFPDRLPDSRSSHQNSIYSAKSRNVIALSIATLALASSSSDEFSGNCRQRFARCCRLETVSVQVLEAEAGRPRSQRHCPEYRGRDLHHATDSLLYTACVMGGAQGHRQGTLADLRRRQHTGDPVLALSPEARQIVYAANAIEILQATSERRFVARATSRTARRPSS